MSTIYEHYYLNELGQEVTFYIGKSKNVVERLPQHITDSVTDEYSKLYKFIRSIGGFEKVHTRILHDRLPEDSDNWVVCYFERLYYDEKAFSNSKLLKQNGFMFFMCFLQFSCKSLLIKYRM